MRPSLALRLSLALCSLLVAASAATGCKKGAPSAQEGNAGSSSVVASIGDNDITVRDVEERIHEQTPFRRHLYETRDKKKELLDDMIHFEIIAEEARRRGYDKDPEVVHAMKQQMVAKLLEKEFDSKRRLAEVAEADVENYYAAHSDEFHKKDELRVGAVFVSSPSKAGEVYAVATTAQQDGSGADERAFRDLVNRYSENETTRPLGGVLPFFDKDSTALPKAVVEASFMLGNVGDVAHPVKADSKWVVVKLLQKRPGYDRPLSEVKGEIRQRLFGDSRGKALEAFVADLKRNTKIVEHDDNLDRVVVENIVGGGGARNEADPHLQRVLGANR